MTTIQDEDAHRGEIEKLNNFPELRMILNPSGCAYYTFPVASDQINMFVQPAAKEGKYHQDYCDKVKNFTVFFTAMKTMKLRKDHCSPPLVGEDNSMVFTSHSVPFPATRDLRSLVAGNGAS